MDCWGAQKRNMWLERAWECVCDKIRFCFNWGTVFPVLQEKIPQRWGLSSLIIKIILYSGQNDSTVYPHVHDVQKHKKQYLVNRPDAGHRHCERSLRVWPPRSSIWDLVWWWLIHSPALCNTKTTHMSFLWCKIKALPSKINITHQEHHTIFHRHAKYGGETIILQYEQTRRLISKCLGRLRRNNNVITAKKLLLYLCFQPAQRANLYCRKSLGLFPFRLLKLAWDTPYHSIKTGTFKQVKGSQLRWNPPHDLSGQRRGDKFIVIQSPSLTITPLPPRRQIKTWHPEINWKRRSKMFELSRPEIPLWGESCSPSICPSNKLSFLVCATTIIVWKALHKDIYFFYLATPPAIFHAQSSGTCRILINQDRNHSECCFWMFPIRWGVICYCRWPLTSPVFLLKFPKWRKQRL